VAAVRAAARDDIRRGAHHITIMANGGIASPTDRIDSDQFSEEAIAAAADEAAMANLYVAHGYTARSVHRCLRNGVRSIEHGNLVDARADERAWRFLVPTLATYRALAEEGVAAGLADKIGSVLDAGIRAVELAQAPGVPMAYGTGLLGTMHRRQLSEFDLGADVVAPADLLRAATVNAATLLRREHEIGRIRPGYVADLIAFEGDPLRDVRLMATLDRRLALVVQAGRITRYN
jgi:imidazolonepropionase-like amidohydrolase